MFTQEQLIGIRAAFEESLKPFGEKMEKGFNRIEEKMEKNFDSHQEQIAKVSVQVTVLEQSIDGKFKKIDEDIKDVQEDLGPLCNAIKDLKWDQKILNHKLSVAEENKPALFLSR